MKAAKAEEPYPKKGARRADGTIAKEFDLVTEAWIRNMWYHPDTKATTATKVNDAGAVMADGKPATTGAPGTSYCRRTSANASRRRCCRKRR